MWSKRTSQLDDIPRIWGLKWMLHKVVLMKATFLLADEHKVENIQFEYIKINYSQTR